MSELGRSIEALRAAVTATANGEGSRTGLDEALEAAAFTSPEIVSVPGDPTVDHVSVRPANVVTVGDLEGALGPARRLPSGPSIGAPRTVLFERTVPEEGSAGATVLAELDDEDVVTRLIVRADRL